MPMIKASRNDTWRGEMEERSRRTAARDANADRNARSFARPTVENFACTKLSGIRIQSDAGTASRRIKRVSKRARSFPLSRCSTSSEPKFFEILIRDTATSPFLRSFVLCSRRKQGRAGGEQKGLSRSPRCTFDINCERAESDGFIGAVLSQAVQPA